MAVRFFILLGFWIVLDGFQPSGLVVGVPAAAFAAWATGKFLPAGRLRIGLRSLGVLTCSVLKDAVVGGIDVARRAFHPALPLKPGLVEVPCGLPPGRTRDAFLAIGGLMPGSLPVDSGSHILVHCLDTDQPVAKQMATQEALLRSALKERSHD